MSNEPLSPASGDIYKYKVEMSVLLNNGKEIIKVDQTNIQYMYIEYDYIKYNMPMIFMSLALDKNVADKMISFSNKSLINMTLYKYVNNGDMPGIKTIYFQEQFIYFLGRDFNNNKSQDYMEQNKNREDIHTITTIGLLKLDHVNNNKKKFSGVLTKTTLTSAVYYCCGHLPLLMEPLKYNNTISQIILPPISSVSKAVAFLNRNVHALYDTSYRFFMDFTMTYLISSSGKKVPVKGEKIDSVVINVKKLNDQASAIQGMFTDKKQLFYVIDVSEEAVQAFYNNSAEKEFNNLDVVGNKSIAGSAELNLGKSSYMKNKTEIMRVPNDNTTLLKNRQSDLQSSLLVLEIHKNDIDTSVFTINKEYNINTIDVYPERQGKYILVRKREVYMREMDHMLVNVLLTFKKVA